MELPKYDPLIECLKVLRNQGYESAKQFLDSMDVGEEERVYVSSNLDMINANDIRKEGEKHILDTDEETRELKLNVLARGYRETLNEDGIVAAQCYFLTLDKSIQEALTERIDKIDLEYLTK